MLSTFVQDKMTELEILKRLALSLTIGLLIGTERGWHERLLKEGTRVAGIRTFGLIGFLGGLTALLSHGGNPVFISLGFFGFILIVIASYIKSTRDQNQDVGTTTEMASLVTFLLGATAVIGHLSIAASGAVVTVLVLGTKPLLHGWLKRLEGKELAAAAKLLLISVVLLPILPNRGYGPWQSLNPYVIWWMVVLVATISFAGYIGVKVAGPRIGILLTSILGGLVSSTALTLTFSKISRKSPKLYGLMAAGIVAASATMFPRILMEVGVVNRSLLPNLLLPMGIMTIASYMAAIGLWYFSRDRVKPEGHWLDNPLELTTALQFGALLALIMFLAKAMKAWLGNSGLYYLSAISGITDVDAITLSLAQMAKLDLDANTAVTGIVLAATVNTVVKGIMASVFGGKKMFLAVGLPLTLIAGLGFTTLYMILN